MGRINIPKREKNMNTKIIGLKRLSVSTLAILTALGATTPAWSTIDNTAVATGVFNGVTTTSDPDTASVPVLSNRELSIVKTVFTEPSITEVLTLVLQMQVIQLFIAIQ